MSDRDRLDQAAGKILDAIENRPDVGPREVVALREDMRLLAGFAQRQSSLEAMADVIERERAAGTLTKPLASVREVDGLLRDLHGWGSEPDALSVSRVGSLLQRSALIVQTLAAELIAQDRKHARLITPEERQAAKEALENVLNDEAGFDVDDLLRAVLRPIRFQTLDVEERAVEVAIMDAIENGAVGGVRDATKAAILANGRDLRAYGGPAGGSMADASRPVPAEIGGDMA